MFLKKIEKQNIFVYFVLKEYISDYNLKSKLWQNQTRICDKSQNVIKLNHSNYNNNKKTQVSTPSRPGMWQNSN